MSKFLAKHLIDKSNENAKVENNIIQGENLNSIKDDVAAETKPEATA
jgi:hypothetical protein